MGYFKCLLVIVSAALQAGCAEHYSSNAYAIVPAQTIKTRSGRFEILDRPDIARLTIVPKGGCDASAEGGGRYEPLKAGALSGDCDSQWVRLGKSVVALVPTDFSPATGVASPGSAYVEPLREYFEQTGRRCALVRGHPLADQQWEFVYNCHPGFDASAITWSEAGRSNALPPPYSTR